MPSAPTSAPEIPSGMFATVFSEVDVSAGAAQELVAENAAIMNATVENFMLEVERIIKNEA